MIGEQNRLNKVKALPHKTTFAIGLTLVLVSNIFSFSFLGNLIGGIILALGFIFVIISSDKKHSNTNKN